jgi:hypothetical protein
MYVPGPRPSDILLTPRSFSVVSDSCTRVTFRQLEAQLDKLQEAQDSVLTELLRQLTKEDANEAARSVVAPALERANQKLQNLVNGSDALQVEINRVKADGVGGGSNTEPNDAYRAGPQNVGPSSAERIAALELQNALLKDDNKDLSNQLGNKRVLDTVEDTDEGSDDVFNAATKAMLDQIVAQNARNERDKRGVKLTVVQQEEETVSNKTRGDEFELRMNQLTNKQLERINEAIEWIQGIPSKQQGVVLDKQQYDAYLDVEIDTRLQDKSILSQQGIKRNDPDRESKIEAFRLRLREQREAEIAFADASRERVKNVLGLNDTNALREWSINLTDAASDTQGKGAATSVWSLLIQNILNDNKLSTPALRTEAIFNKRSRKKEEDAKRREKAEENRRAAEADQLQMAGHLRVYNAWKGVWQALADGRALNDDLKQADPDTFKRWSSQLNQKYLRLLAMDRNEAKAFKVSAKTNTFSTKIFSRPEVRGLLYTFFLNAKEAVQVPGDDGYVDINPVIKNQWLPQLRDRLKELDKQNPRPDIADVELDPGEVLPRWAISYKPTSDFKPASEAEINEKPSNNKVVIDDVTKEEAEAARKRTRAARKWILLNNLPSPPIRPPSMPDDDWTEDDLGELAKYFTPKEGGGWERIKDAAAPASTPATTPETTPGSPKPPLLAPPPLAPPPLAPPPLAPPPLAPPPLAPPPLAPPPLAQPPPEPPSVPIQPNAAPANPNPSDEATVPFRNDKRPADLKDEIERKINSGEAKGSLKKINQP